MQLRIESRGIGIERIRRARAVGWIALVLLLLVTYGAVRVSLCVVPALGILLDAIVLATLYAEPRQGALQRSTTPGSLSVDVTGILVERGRERMLVPRAQIVEGWVESARGCARIAVRLVTADVVTAEVEDEDRAREVLRAAGLAADQRVLRMALTSAASQESHGEFFRVLGLLGLGPAFPVLALVLLSACYRIGLDSRAWTTIAWCAPALMIDAALLYRLIQGLKAKAATIGTDGVAIRGAGRARFISFQSVARAELSETGVRLRLVDGASVVLPVDPLVGRTLERRRQLFDRIREAMTARRPKGDIAARLELLDRKGHAMSAWQSRLVGLLRADNGYREVPFDREDLAHVVEDASIAPERRVAAAVALSSEPDPTIQRRIRLAIEACADDELRDSLTRAAEGELDEGALERAAESQRPAPRSAP